MERDRIYFLDMVEAARLAVSYVEGVSEAAFLEDTQLQDAVIRRLEIVGEAARRVSAATRHSLPEVPWMEVVGMRNLVIHEYDDVDLNIVWDTVRNHLPPLIAILDPHVPREGG